MNFRMNLAISEERAKLPKKMERNVGLEFKMFCRSTVTGRRKNFVLKGEFMVIFTGLSVIFRLLFFGFFRIPVNKRLLHKEGAVLQN